MIIDLRPAFRALPRFCRKFMPYSWYAEEWWALNNALADWIAPQIIALRDKGRGCPGSIYMQNDKDDEAAFAEWRGILTEMIEGFDLLKEDDSMLDHDTDCPKVQRAFDLLAKHWDALWD